ncbi:MAG TPA: hypothetical protein VMM80_01295 [Bacteroidota bacterium]|nr:hypothetical protein [Bacteroidota bacterium]
MPDTRQDRIQRALNEQKRKELEEKYGARFSFNDTDAPPEIIGEWLQTVEEFERRFQTAGKTTVRAYAGNPPARPPSSIPAGRMLSELRNLLEHLSAHAIAVHFDRTVPAVEAYRFIVEELFEMEIDDIHLEGMTHNFVYGDFHPDESACASMFAGRFLYSLFSRDVKSCMRRIDVSGLCSPTGRNVTREEFRGAIERFISSVAVFTASDVTERECTVLKMCATVKFALSWSGLEAGTLRQLHAAGVATLDLKRDGLAWNVTRIECPGWMPW